MAEEVEQQTQEAEKVYSSDPMINGFLKRQHEESEPQTQEIVTTEETTVVAEVEKPEEVVEEVKTDQSFDIDKVVSEKSQGKFKTLDELLNQPASLKDPEFANEDSKKLYEAIIGGKENEVIEILQKKNADYSKASTEDLLFIKYKQEHPYMSDEDIRAEVADRYLFDVKVEEDDEVNLSPQDLKEKKARIARAERMAKADASEIKAKLEELKPKLELPTFEKEKVEVKESFDEVMEKYATLVDQASKEVPDEFEHEFKIEIPDGDDKGSYSTQFKIAGDDKKALEDYVKRFVPPLGKENDYITDGKVNVSKIVAEGADRLFGKRAFQVLLRESISNTKKGVIESIKNIEVVPGSSVPEQPETNEDFLARAIRY